MIQMCHQMSPDVIAITYLPNSYYILHDTIFICVIAHFFMKIKKTNVFTFANKIRILLRQGGNHDFLLYFCPERYI